MNNITRRDFLRASSAAAAWTALPALETIPASGQTTLKGVNRIDPVELVNPELRPALEQLQKRMPLIPSATIITSAQLQAIRTMFDRPASPLPPAATQRNIPVQGQRDDVPVYVINARPGTSRPAIVYFHGGGFIAGSARADVPNLLPYVQALDCVIVNAEYQLAPEARYPKSLEQNYAVLKWLHTNAAEVGADPNRIALLGGSAGGGHAAMLAIAARDRGELPIIFQSLTYPMLDDRTGSTRQPPPHIGTFVWTRQFNRFGWQSLLGDVPGGKTAPAGAIPARETNLAGLPPAWIGVGAIDLFADEDVDYARRLIEAGVPTELLVVPGAYHGFDSLVPGASVSKRFNLARLNALAGAFGVKQLETTPAR